MDLENHYEKLQNIFALTHCSYITKVITIFALYIIAETFSIMMKKLKSIKKLFSYFGSLT